MFGGIDKTTGKALFQPMRKKSDTRDAMEAYMAHITADCPSIQAHMQRYIKGLGFCAISGLY